MNTRDPFFRLPLTELTPMRDVIQSERDQEMAEHEAQQKLLRDAESIADWLCGECIDSGEADEIALLNKEHAIKSEDGFADELTTSELLCLLFSSPWEKVFKQSQQELQSRYLRAKGAL